MYLEPDWQKILKVAWRMKNIKLRAVRKAVLLTAGKDNPMAYLMTVVDDWIVRDIRTLDDFENGKGSHD